MLFEVQLLRVNPNAKIPTQGSKESAYMDLYAAENALIDVDAVRVVTTGWRIEVPPGWFLDIRPRSGLSIKGLTVCNSPGTVDPDYRGELKVILVNHGEVIHRVNIGDRIAQCALMPVYPTMFVEVDRLTESDRGQNGYGSTGK